MTVNIKLEHITCDLCGCATYKTRYRKPDNWLCPNQYEFPVVECTKCALVYINPRPTQEAMADYYPSDYHLNRNSEEFQIRYSNQSEYLGQLSNEKILDIGCARGDFLNFLNSRHPEITTVGVDLFSEGVDYPFVEFHKNTLLNSSLTADDYDLVTAWAVFEHLHEPSAYFEEVHRVLKKGGKFVFLVTNSESLYGTAAYTEDIPRHTYHFSENSLNKYAEKYGFTFSKCSYDKRFWDPTGRGTFHYKFMEFFGSTWEKRWLGQSNAIQQLAGRIGLIIDKVVFSTHWEADMKRSGIIIAEFVK